MEFTLMDLVLTTMGVLVTMAVICCLCCLSMKFSDLRMKCYIIETAKKRGIKVDPDKLDPKHSCRSPLANENCTIMVPDVRCGHDSLIVSGDSSRQSDSYF